MLIRLILGFWGVLVLYGAAEAVMEALLGGKSPTPISYRAWNQKLFQGKSTDNASRSR